MLDTDVLIDVQRGVPNALAWYRGLPELPLVPGLVVMEMMQGAQNKKEMQQVQKLVAPMPIVWPTEADCERAMNDFAAHRLSHNLGLIDSLIAACATERDATLCTFNAKHYKAVPGLSMMKPYVR